MPTFIFQLKCFFYVRGTLTSAWNTNSCSAKQSEDCQKFRTSMQVRQFNYTNQRMYVPEYSGRLKPWFKDTCIAELFVLRSEWFNTDILWTIHVSTYHMKEQTLCWVRSVCFSTRLFKLAWFKVFQTLRLYWQMNWYPNRNDVSFNGKCPFLFKNVCIVVEENRSFR